MADREAFEKRVGTTLRNKWTLERLLGVGGMAAVYVASHKIGRREAIKILHPDAARSNEMRARFEQEAHAVNRLEHPGVVEIRDIDTTEDGSPFLVMELLEGEPLSERAQRLGTIAVDELLRLVDELLDVLGVAHAQGIVHRDIKLDNLFVLHDGRLKVLDFGIAHMKSGASISGTPQTRFGEKLGTAPYMPPEQVKGLPIDGRADLFAVGATMFRIISKRRIHEATTEPELLLLMATTPAPPLASVAPGAPEGVCMIVDRALAFEKGDRYPDAGTMQDDVRAVRRGERPPYAAARLAEGGAPNANATAGVPSPSADPYADKPTVIGAKADDAPASAGARATAPASAFAPASAAAPASAFAPASATGLAPSSTAEQLPPPGFGPPPSMYAAAPPSPVGSTLSGASVTAVPSSRTDRTTSIIIAFAVLLLVIAGAGIGWLLLGSAFSDAPRERPGASPAATRGVGSK